MTCLNNLENWPCLIWKKNSHHFMRIPTLTPTHKSFSPKPLTPKKDQQLISPDSIVVE